MKSIVTGRHVVVTPRLRQIIEQKLAKLDRLLNDKVVSIQVVLAQERRSRSAEVVLHARGDHVLHGLGEGNAWTQAIGGAVDKVAQQAHTLKGKWDKRRRRATGTRARAAATRPWSPAADDGTRLVRDSRYVVRSLRPDAAAGALATSRRPFVVFRDPDTDAVAVVYRRNDGRVALIDTGD